MAPALAIGRPVNWLSIPLTYSSHCDWQVFAAVVQHFFFWHYKMFQANLYFLF
jgi:hypothetical protein